MRKNPHVRIRGGLGSVTALVYPTSARRARPISTARPRTGGGFTPSSATTRRRPSAASSSRSGRPPTPGLPTKCARCPRPSVPLIPTAGVARPGLPERRGVWCGDPERTMKVSHLDRVVHHPRAHDIPARRKVVDRQVGQDGTAKWVQPGPRNRRRSLGSRRPGRVVGHVEVDRHILPDLRRIGIELRES